jgi:hypothetical protein
MAGLAPHGTFASGTQSAPLYKETDPGQSARQAVHIGDRHKGKKQGTLQAEAANC